MIKQLIFLIIAAFVFVSCSEKKTTVNKTDTVTNKEKNVEKVDDKKVEGNQKTFSIKHTSKNYDFTIAPSDTSRAKGNLIGVIIRIYKKGEDKPFQEIISASCNFSINDSTKLPSVNDEKGIHAIIINDFNFDGLEDIAVQNGMPASMQSTHPYDIYLYSSERNNFVFNKDFTVLAENGMFEVDTPDNSLRSSYVSGCCHHETNKYKITDNKPTMVYTEVLNETGKDPEIKAYTKTLENGKWKKGVIKK